MKTKWNKLEKESASDRQSAALLVALGVCLWLVVQLSIVHYQLLAIIEGGANHENSQQITR
jgi:hypothetical protein